VSKTKKRGWFRTGDEEEGKEFPAGTADVAISAPLAPPLPPAPVRDVAAAPPLGDEGAIDLAAILEVAGISSEDRDRVARARSLMQALPTGVSAAVRRQIVETALTTFGIATDRIVDAGQKVSAALDGFIASNRQATDRLLDEARARVQALEQEIFRVRQAAEHASAIHQKRIHEASVEATAVHQILEFFGAGGPDVELDETTEDRSDWGVQVPVPPPARAARDTASKPPPLPHPEPAKQN
jgi:hypothetical protein